MAAIGGAPESVTLDGVELGVAADADVAQNLGGYSNEVMPNGDGSARLIKRRIPFKLEGLPVVIDQSNGDLEYLQELANRLDFWPVTITYPSGVVYQGTAQIEGDIDHATGSATASITIKGVATLSQQ